MAIKFNLGAIGLGASNTAEKAAEAKAERDAARAARAAIDAAVLAGWAVVCAAFRKMGAAPADMPSQVTARPTMADVAAIEDGWRTAQKPYITHARGDAMMLAARAFFGDAMTYGNSTADVSRATPKRGGGCNFSERARTWGADWADANKAADVDVIVGKLTKLAKAAAKATDKHAADRANEAAQLLVIEYWDGLDKSANADALTDAQLAQYWLDLPKPAGKRRPMSEILAAK